MNNRRFTATLLAGAVALAALTGCTATATAGSLTSSPSASTSGSSDTVLPVDANPIVNDSSTPGLSVTYAAVEDNVDQATGQAISDQLELTIANATSTDVSGLEVFYTMTDATTGQSESYYQDLGALTVPAGSDVTVYCDNGTGTGTGAGHYPENTFSLYRSSSNQVDFTIEVSTPGLAPATAIATKGVGTGEVAD